MTDSNLLKIGTTFVRSPEPHEKDRVLTNNEKESTPHKDVPHKDITRPRMHCCIPYTTPLKSDNG